MQSDPAQWQQAAVDNGIVPAKNTAATQQGQPAAVGAWEQAARENSVPLAARPAEEETSSSANQWQQAAVDNGIGSASRRREPSGEAGESENAPWYTKAWDWANTPFINFHRWDDPDTSGFRKGVEDVASGIFTPLGAALAIGTWGTGPALEALGLTARELPVAVQGIRALVDAGFTAQQAIGVAKESPQFLDALKTGDYNQAERLGVNVLAGGAFTALGARGAMRDAGELWENTGKNKPSEQTAAIGREANVRDGDITAAGNAAKIAEESMRKVLPKATPEDLGAIARHVEAGGDKEDLRNKINYIATSADRPDWHIADPKEEEDKKIFGNEPKPQGYSMFNGADLLPDEQTVDHYKPGTPLAEERKEYNDRAMDQLFEGKQSVPKGKQPEAFIMGGGTGSGKTTASEKLLAGNNQSSHVNIQSDWFKTRSPEFGYLKDNDPWNASARVHRESSELVKQAIDRALDGRKNFILDATTSGDDSRDLIQKIKDHGYKVRLVFSDIPTGEAIDRSFHRAMTSDKPLNAGRFVYDDVIRRTHQGAALSFFDIKNLADEVHLFDNNVPRGSDPIEIYRRLENGPEEVYNEDRYEQYRNKGRGSEAGATGTIPERDRRIQAELQASERLRSGAGTLRVGEGIQEGGDRSGSSRRLQEIADQQNLKKNYTPKELESLHAKYLKAYQGLTPEQLKVADMVRTTLNDSFARAQQHNVINSFVEDYLTHIWDLDKEKNSAAERVRSQARTGGFSTNVSMARKRVFDSSFEGELLGKHLKVDDPIAIAAHHVNTVRRAIANRTFLDRLRDLNVRMPDKQPIVAISGRGDRVENDNGEATLVNPYRVRNIRIAQAVVDGLQSSGDLERFLEEKRIVKFQEPGKKPVYAWNPSDYVRLNNPAFRDWIFAAHDTKGSPIHVKGDLVVHPDAAEYLKRRLGLDTSPLRESKVGGALLKAGGEAKNVLLSFSPFHVAQEALRAVMTGVSPFGVEKFNIDADPLLRELVDHTLTLGRDHRAVEDYMEGVGANSKLIAKIPLARDVQSWLNSFLFDRYIPGLKVRAARSLVERYRAAYPEWTRDKVLTTAAEHTNETFGGINYRALGRSAAAQDYFRLAALAPDWLESELRFTARLFGNEGKIARQDVTRMAAGLWATARVLNYLSTGQAHNEAPFGVVSKDKEGHEKIYSIRTLPTDILHLASDPMGFLRGRVSPLGRAGLELYSGRDQSGRKLTPAQTFVDVLRNAVPIPAQAIGAAASGQLPAGNTALDQLVKSSLGTVSEYKTAAEQKADQIASDHNEQGPLDRDKLGMHQAKMRFEDQLRAGQMQPQDVFRMVETGQLPVQEAKEIMRNAAETKGMTPETARLYTRSIRLPMKDFLDVWGVATDEQRAALSKLLLRKRQTYIKDAIKDMTPAQRSADPTYRKLRAIFPNLPPW